MHSFINPILFYFYVFVGLTMTQCKTIPPPKCKGEAEALVIDMSTIDGCSDLLLMTNGDKLQPVKHDKETPLKSSQIITFNYIKTKALPTCNLADFVGELSCIEYKDMGTKAPCKSQDDVAKIPWMKDLLKDPQLRVIYLITEGDVVLYLVEKTSNYELYTCEGVLTCHYKKGISNECSAKIHKSGDQKIIFTNEARPH